MGCCDDTDSACVFSRALLARSAGCACVARRALGEREVLECTQPVARTNCSLLSALMRERARFALKLPAGELPLMHAQVLRPLPSGTFPGVDDAELYAFLDGELDDRVMLQVETHLRRCSPCLEAFDFEADLRRVIAAKCTEQVTPEVRARFCGLLHELSSGGTDGVSGVTAPSDGS